MCVCVFFPPKLKQKTTKTEKKEKASSLENFVIDFFKGSLKETKLILSPTFVSGSPILNRSYLRSVLL